MLYEAERTLPERISSGRASVVDFLDFFGDPTIAPSSEDVLLLSAY